MIGFQRSVYRLEFKLKVNFYFQTSRIYSVTQKQFEKIFLKQNKEDISRNKNLHGIYIPEKKNDHSEFGYLIIDSTFELESYDSYLEGAAKIRPDIFIILGILTFVIGEAFIPANSFSSGFNSTSNHISGNPQDSILEYNKLKISNDLKKILQFINHSSIEKQTLCFTIFERWRKALYLEKESEDNDIFIDESVLAYMHILEVLADEFKNELVKKNEIERTNLSRRILEYAKDPDCKLKEIIKLLNILDHTRVSLKKKIFQLLVSFSLDDAKVRSIVERFIEHRNAIAHGRKNLYQEKLIFPLPQFFSFIKDIDEDVEIIKILAARCISEFFNIDLWKIEWELKLQNEIIPFSIVADFIKDYKQGKIKTNEFLKSGINDVYPYTLSFYYKKDKLKFKDLENILESVIEKCRKNKSQYQQLFEAAVILSDSLKSVLANRCKKIISDVYHNKWTYYSNMRHVLKDYEYHGKKLLWFEEWLKDGKKKYEQQKLTK